MNTYKIVCRHCQSEDVTQVCDARWDIEKQAWKISDTWNNYYCHDCDGDARVNRIEITQEVTK
jgi:hypothetical protein